MARISVERAATLPPEPVTAIDIQPVLELAHATFLDARAMAEALGRVFNGIEDHAERGWTDQAVLLRDPMYFDVTSPLSGLRGDVRSLAGHVSVTRVGRLTRDVIANGALSQGDTEGLIEEAQIWPPMLESWPEDAEACAVLITTINPGVRVNVKQVVEWASDRMEIVRGAEQDLNFNTLLREVNATGNHMQGRVSLAYVSIREAVDGAWSIHAYTYVMRNP